MRKITLLVFILFSFSLLSQNQNLDSLLLEAKKTNNDTVILKAYAKIGFKTIFSEKEKAQKYILEGKKLAENKNNKLWLAELNNIYGIYYAVSENYDSARYHYNKSLLISRKYNFKKVESKSINNLGLSFWNQSKFNKALDFFFESLKIDDKLNDEESKISGFSNVGLIYQEMKQFEKALKYHYKALKIREKYNDIYGLTISYNNIGICYRSLKQYSKAIASYQKGIEFAKQSNNKLNLSKHYSNLGNVYIDINEYEKGVSALLKSIEIIENFANADKEIMIAYGNLVTGYNRLNQLNKAFKYSEKAIKILDRNPDLRNYANTLMLSSAETNFRLGKVKKGEKIIEKYIAINDSIFSDKSAIAIAETETKYQTEKKEKELLKTRTEKAETELELSKTRSWIFVLIGGLLLTLILFFAINQRNKRKAQEQITQEKERGFKAIIDAQEEERSKIARELHDGVVQQIGSVILRSRNFFLKNKLNENKESEELIKSLENSNQDLRNISHQMMPRALKELGILAALNDLLDNSLSYSDIKFNLEHFNIESRLPEKIEVTIYRITQELINNIIKHSKANEVSVQLFKNNDNIILIVEDNGVGFSSKENKKGIGLLNISSRLNMVNGNVNFEPSPKSGTLVTIKIPL